jgi:hypothetical protein
VGKERENESADIEEDDAFGFGHRLPAKRLDIEAA